MTETKDSPSFLSRFKGKSCSSTPPSQPYFWLPDWHFRLHCWLFLHLPLVRLHPARFLLPLRPLPPHPPLQQASLQESHGHPLLLLGGLQCGQYPAPTITRLSLYNVLTLQTLLQTFYGVKIVLTGDHLISENALIVLNHPTRCSNQWNKACPVIKLHQNLDNLDIDDTKILVVPEKRFNAFLTELNPPRILEQSITNLYW